MLKKDLFLEMKKEVLGFDFLNFLKFFDFLDFRMSFG